MKTKLLKILRSKFNLQHNNHIWFADYKYDSIYSNSKPHVNLHSKINIVAMDIRLLIKKHNDYIGLTKYQLKKLNRTLI